MKVRTGDSGITCQSHNVYVCGEIWDDWVGLGGSSNILESVK